MGTLKQGFALLVAIFAVLTFSTLAMYVVSNKATTSKLSLEKYYYTQSLLHMDFAKEYIKRLKYEDIDFNQISFKDNFYEVRIDIISDNSKHIAHISVSPLSDDTKVRLYDEIVVWK